MHASIRTRCWGPRIEWVTGKTIINGNPSVEGNDTGDGCMRTDAELRLEGLRALSETLGAVEAERFITLILRESFDYTLWQRNLWPGKTVEEISAAAMEFRKAPLSPE